MGKTTRIYVYLARRDRKGIRVLAISEGTAKTTKVEDTSLLGLDHETKSTLDRIVHDNRMYWELWIEPAESYQNLKERLAYRGYTDLPMSSTPMIDLVRGSAINTAQLPERRVMIQKRV